MTKRLIVYGIGLVLAGVGVALALMPVEGKLNPMLEQGPINCGTVLRQRVHALCAKPLQWRAIVSGSLVVSGLVVVGVTSLIPGRGKMDVSGR